MVFNRILAMIFIGMVRNVLQMTLNKVKYDKTIKNCLLI